MVKKKIKVLIHKTLNSKVQKNDVLLVSYGYARNYLLPQKIASLATKYVIEKSYKTQQKQELENLQQHQKQLRLKKFLEQIYNINFICQIKQDYRFFGSMSSTQVTQSIYSTTGIRIKKTQVDLPNIRKIGLYRINIKLSSSVTASIHLHILPIMF